MAKIVLFVGSVRKERHGIKVARYMENKLKKRGHNVIFVDPKELKLPLLYQRIKYMKNPSKVLKQLQKDIKSADGYLAVTPEYNHSFSSAIKNTLDHFLEEYFFKPSAIVSYSMGGFGGIRALEQLRLVFLELGAPPIPSVMAFSKVHETFDGKGDLLDTIYEKNVDRFLTEFEWYIEALKNQRKKRTPY